MQQRLATPKPCSSYLESIGDETSLRGHDGVVESFHKVSCNGRDNGTVPERWQVHTASDGAVQCEGIMVSLEGSHKVSFNAPDNGSVTGRLGAAAAQENDKYINSEGDRQQLLIR